jgi:hypothetical protein
VADCVYPVFEHLKTLAAQGEVIYQDDTHVRILSLIAEHRQAHDEGTTGARTGMNTTALVAKQGGRSAYILQDAPMLGSIWQHC